MDIKEMSMEDVEVRLSEIETEVRAEDADIRSLSAEVDELNERKNAIIAEAEEKRALMAKVAQSTETRVVETKEERKTMETVEIRNTPAYVEAYANYIKTGKDAECRALLTENATNGTVPVPEFVYDIVKTAWERDGIMRLVRKSYLRGNVKVGFEISGTDAIIHTEGGNAIDPENLVLGVVNLVPASVKKVVQISDEVYDMRGTEFLSYVYDELAYRIAKKVADTLLTKIMACGTQSTATCVGVPTITASTVSLSLVAKAMAELSAEAENPVIVMNRATWGAFKEAQASASYAYDPFEGLPVVYNNTLKSATVASSGDTILIVGDFGHGALANFPNGEDITFKFDDTTLKKQDLIEILGREYVAVEPVAPNAFVTVKKA